MPPVPELDSIDRQLLSILQVDGRRPVKDLAAAVGAVWWAIVCWLALRGRRWLTTARLSRRVDRVGGTALIALGSTLAAS